MDKKKGRPKKFNSRKHVCKTRMSDEEAFEFTRTCEKEGFNTSEGLRVAVKALKYLSDRGLIYCVTENENDDPLNYCVTENNEEDEDDIW